MSMNPLNRPLSPQANIANALQQPTSLTGGAPLAAAAPTQQLSQVQQQFGQFSQNPFFFFLIIPILFQLLQLMQQMNPQNPPQQGTDNPVPLDPNAQVIGNSGVDKNDIVDYIWMNHKGNNQGTSNSLDARPNSRFRNAGQNEFDAALASVYTGEFKAHALGLDTRFQPGENVSQIAANIETGLKTPMTAEAETLSKVAAIYRSDFAGGTGAYDNPRFAQLVTAWTQGGLQQGWLKPEIANRATQAPGFGDKDVPTIGAAVTILNNVNSGNPQRDQEIRSALLNSIFDFKNNTPNSPFGAVPTDAKSLKKYQDAIAIARDGTMDQLMDNYRKGIKTNNPVFPKNQPPGPGGNVDPNQLNTIDPNFNFRNLSNTQRSEVGLIDQHRAAEHLWGRQMIAKGFQDGGINISVLQDMMVVEMQRGATQQQAQQRVLDSVSSRMQQLGVANPSAVLNQSGFPEMLLQGFKVQDGSVVLRQPEVDLSVDVIAKDLMEFGRVTGRNLDRAMATTFQQSTGSQFPVNFEQAPLHFAAGPTRMPVDNVNNLTGMAAATGISPEEQMIMRLWSHDRLMPKKNPNDKGQVTGEILPYTLIAGQNALDAGADPAITRKLLELDVMKDGKLDGDTLRTGFASLLPKLYFGAQAGGVNMAQLEAAAQQGAQARGISPQQVSQNVQQGVQKALDFAQTMVKDHPVLTGVGTAGAIAMSAVCPFMAGTTLVPMAGAIANNQFARDTNVQLPT